MSIRKRALGAGLKSLFSGAVTTGVVSLTVSDMAAVLAVGGLVASWVFAYYILPEDAGPSPARVDREWFLNF